MNDVDAVLDMIIDRVWVHSTKPSARAALEAELREVLEAGRSSQNVYCPRRERYGDCNCFKCKMRSAYRAIVARSKEEHERQQQEQEPDDREGSD